MSGTKKWMAMIGLFMMTACLQTESKIDDCIIFSDEDEKILVISESDQYTLKVMDSLENYTNHNIICLTKVVDGVKVRKTCFNRKILKK